MLGTHKERLKWIF